MKISIIIFAFTCTVFSSHSYTQGLSTKIKVQAMDMAKAFVKNDFDSFVKYMHPAIIAFAGGKEELKTKMDSASITLNRFGARFKRYWIGNPGEIISYKNQLQAVLPASSTLVTPLGELTIETSFIVLSDDDGKNWWFIDTNVYKADKLKNILPDLSGKLIIPPAKQPKLQPVTNN